ncbi:MAG TPA: exosome complex protein Rrp42, partial [Candidatus Caldiarchaeum subterraneum]|nr:exosome complex protein Rrp42 [Candidatus Caldarchaeum subterraneum]
DGRRPDELRPITITTNVIEKADGSSLVKMGGTKILTCIKVELGTPYPDRPNEGVFTINAELLPLASASFEPGPPDEHAIELARVVDRCIRESKAIDLEKLVITEGEKVYMLYIDIYVLDYDGNYFDPALISAVTAVATCNVPRYELRNGKYEKTGETFRVSMKTIPASVMMGVVKDKILVDPTPIEESVLDTSIITGFDSEDNLVSLQKNTTGMLDLNIIDKLLDVGREKVREIRSRIMEVIGDGQEETS